LGISQSYQQAFGTNKHAALGQKQVLPHAQGQEEGMEKHNQQNDFEKSFKTNGQGKGYSGESRRQQVPE